jgi:hypothetical protein
MGSYGAFNNTRIFSALIQKPIDPNLFESCKEIRISYIW